VAPARGRPEDRLRPGPTSGVNTGLRRYDKTVPHERDSLTARNLRKAMDAIYRLCVVVASVALVLISVVIPWGVYTRYVLNHAASWPEPMAILLTIVLTFIGAAACYRVEAHMRVAVLVGMLPAPWRPLAEFLSEALVGLLGLFMVIWGAGLVETTWHQSIAEFPQLSVGVTYLPIPIGGALMLLFVAERLSIGPPPLSSSDGPLH
jgi:TRAP-type C4-dicarboxylate transport system permease small subunit